MASLGAAQVAWLARAIERAIEEELDRPMTRLPAGSGAMVACADASGTWQLTAVSAPRMPGTEGAHWHERTRMAAGSRAGCAGAGTRRG